MSVAAPKARKKVTAFILRPGPDGSPELLVYTFADAPEVPARLPGGGAEAGGAPEVAVLREVLEETGLSRVSIVRKLGVQRYDKPYIHAHVERHDFLLRAHPPAPSAWSHRVAGSGDDAGDVFCCRWVSHCAVGAVAIEHRAFLTPDYLPELFRPSL